MSNLGGRPTTSWTDDRVSMLVGMIDQGLTVGQIAHGMDISRSAVSGQIHRMKKANNPRLDTPGYAAMKQRHFRAANGERRRTNRLRLDEVAELLSQDLTLHQCAAKLHLTFAQVYRNFQRICNDLGRQAA